MPKSGPYMHFKVVRSNFGRFRGRWDQATHVSLVQAGKVGKETAKARLKQKQKSRGSQRTQKSIGYKVISKGVGPKMIQITTGTLAGVFVEVGAHRRHSDMEGYGYLKAGGHAAVKVLPGLVRARMHRARL